MGLGHTLTQQRFPKRIKIGIRAVGWIESEVQLWVEKRIEARRKDVKSLR